MRKAYLADIRRYQREHEPRILIGVRNICAYTKIGPHTLKDLVDKYDFPATRLPDGRWCTSKKLIDDWIIQRWRTTRTTKESHTEAENAVLAMP